jgi:hypothetical protein
MKKIIATIIIILIIISVFGGYHWVTSVNINNNTSLISKIEIKDKVTGVTIVKTYKDDGQLFILYNANDNLIHLHICEKDSFFNFRYRVGWGGSKINESFSTYLTEDTEEALIVVFGDNRKLMANKYKLENGENTYTKNIKDVNFVLDVYRIPNGTIDTTDDRLQLYNSNDQLLQE